MIIALEYYNYRFFAKNDLVIEKGRRELKEINHIHFYPIIGYSDNPYITFEIREIYSNESEQYYTSIKNAEYLSKELYSPSNGTPIYIPCTSNQKEAHRIPDYDQRDKLLMSEVDISDAIKLLISEYKLIIKDDIDSRIKTFFFFDKDEFVIKRKFSEHNLQKYMIETFYNCFKDRTFLVWEEKNNV